MVALFDVLRLHLRLQIGCSFVGTVSGMRYGPWDVSNVEGVNGTHLNETVSKILFSGRPSILSYRHFFVSSLSSTPRRNQSCFSS